MAEINVYSQIPLPTKPMAEGEPYCSNCMEHADGHKHLEVEKIQTGCKLCGKPCKRDFCNVSHYLQYSNERIRVEIRTARGAFEDQNEYGVSSTWLLPTR